MRPLSRRPDDGGVESVGNKPEEFAAYIKAEVAHWVPIIKACGAGAE